MPRIENLKDSTKSSTQTVSKNFCNLWSILSFTAFLTVSIILPLFDLGEKAYDPVSESHKLKLALDGFRFKLFFWEKVDLAYRPESCPEFIDQLEFESDNLQNVFFFWTRVKFVLVLQVFLFKDGEPPKRSGEPFSFDKMLSFVTTVS